MASTPEIGCGSSGYGFFFFFFFFSFLLLLNHHISAQQSYPSTFNTLDCTTHNPHTSGYLCSPPQPHCHTFAYYLLHPSSNLHSLPAYLFQTTASAIASASNISLSHNLTLPHPLFIPLHCTCLGHFSAHNINYTIQPTDLLFLLANNTYQGLTTCQAIQDANPAAAASALQIGSTYTFPLRCACPSQQQINKGFSMLLTYPVQNGDTIVSVADMFHVQLQDFLAANNLTSVNQSIFPATTVLIPLTSKPSQPPFPKFLALASSPMPFVLSSTSHTVLFVGIAIAIAVLVLSLAVVASLFVKYKRASKTKGADPSPKHTLLLTSKLQDNLLEGVQFATTDKVLRYTFEDLQAATQNFSPSCHIRGAVYRGVLKDRVVAIKKVTTNVSRELHILQTIHHSHLVSLLGVCMIGPHDQSYLVYGYAENGSLNDWLHERPMSSSSSSFLSWNMRLQVAFDVATGLQYIHDHTSPSYVHKDIKSSNILLDEKFRGKIANFGLAKSAEETRDPALLTRQIVGTQGYMAPERIKHGLVSPKVDVFSFGVVLLEMLSGQKAVIRDEEGGIVAGSLYESIGPVLDASDAKEKIKTWMDSLLGNSYPLDCAYQLAKLARNCVAEDPNSRPRMRDVAYAISKILEISVDWESSGVLEEQQKQQQRYTDSAFQGR